MKRMLLVAVCLSGLVAVGADGTVHRTWTATEGYWNEGANWNGGVPANSKGGVIGETSYFTGSPASGGDFLVKFPFGGFSESTYTLFVDLANGKSVTFDATGTSWTKAAGAYPSSWQVMTLGTHSTAGVSYPHLFTVNLANGAASTSRAVMQLTDGVVKVSRDDQAGSSVELVRGGWNFYDADGTANGNNLVFFGTAGMPNGKVIFREGSAFKANIVNLQGKSEGGVWLIEGGEHEVRGVNIANDGASLSPTLKMTGGKLTLPGGSVQIGCNNGKTGNLILDGTAQMNLANGNLSIAYGGGTIGNATIGGEAKVTTEKDFVLCQNSPATATVTMDGKSSVQAGGNVTIGSGSSAKAKMVVGGAARVTAGKNLYLALNASSDCELVITNEAAVSAAYLHAGDVNGGSTTAITVADNGTLTVSGVGVFAGNQGTAYLTFKDHAKGRMHNIDGGIETGASAKSTFYATFKDDAEVVFDGYFRPTYAYGGKGAPMSVVKVQDRARLIGTATKDSGAAGGGFNLGPGAGSSRMEISGDAYVETAARFTLSQMSKTMGELVISGNGRLVAPSPDGFIVGRAMEGCGNIEISENGSLEVYSMAFGGNYAWGNNTPGTLRMTMTGGSIYGSNALTIGGTNTLINLNGGKTSFATWNVGCEPKVDPNAETVTNTVFITGGEHTIRAYNGSGTSLTIGNTNGFARVEMTGGKLNANAMVQVGNKANGGCAASFAMRGGTFSVAQKDADSTKDSKIVCSLGTGVASDFEFTGGEIVANSIRGGGGVSSFLADGGKFTVLNTLTTDWALSRFTVAKLGAKGLEVNVKAGLNAASNQAFVDADGAEGLFTKTGTGTLTVVLASDHAKTVVAAGKLAFDGSVRTFGKRLSIGEGGFVLVEVPAAAGEYDVLTLGAELTEAELRRILPVTWADGYTYTASQRTEDGVTTVTCKVAAGGPTGRKVGETTVYAEPQTLAGYLNVTAEGVNVTFRGATTLVGSEYVIDVPRGSVVTFEQPIESAYTTVTKKGAGQVVFKSANPNFYGTWRQSGGTFDIQNAAFSDGGDGLELTTDTIRGSGETPVTVVPKMTVRGATAQKRVVVRADQEITFAGGWNSMGGGIVKCGAAPMNLVMGNGSYALGTSNVAAGDGGLWLDRMPEDGASPSDATVVQNGQTAGAGLQVLEGKFTVRGAGVTKTTVNNQQSIYVSAGYLAQAAEAEMEISDCTYNADGTTRSFFVGQTARNTAFSHPSLKVTNARLVSHRMQIAGGTGTAVPVYPTVEIKGSTVQFESGFQVGAASDKCHPTLRLVNTQVNQRRDGYAIGHSFCRDVKVEIVSNSLLNATYTTAAGNNWKGIQFEQGAWGTIRVASGSKLQTSFFNVINDGATDEKHVDLIFDGGVLEMTGDAVDAHATTTFAAPDCQGFTTEGEGMKVQIGTGLTHTFATPFRGEGTVTKIGEGTLKLARVPDQGSVFRQEGATLVAEGVLDLGGTEQSFAALGGPGLVQNGTVRGALLAKIGASADEIPTLGDGVTLKNVRAAVVGEGAELDVRIAVAKVAGGEVPAGLSRRTVNGKFSVSYTVEDGVLYAKLGPKPGVLLIVR